MTEIGFFGINEIKAFASLDNEQFKLIALLGAGKYKIEESDTVLTEDEVFEDIELHFIKAIREGRITKVLLTPSGVYDFTGYETIIQSVLLEAVSEEGEAIECIDNIEQLVVLLPSSTIETLAKEDEEENTILHVVCGDNTCIYRMPILINAGMNDKEIVNYCYAIALSEHIKYMKYDEVRSNNEQS